jgi:hypothetical protein
MPATARPRIALFVALMSALPWLTACTTMPSARLAEQVAPVRSVWLVVSPGPSSGRHLVSQALPSRMPDMLRKNGVAVSGYRELARPLHDVDELERLWADQLPLHAQTSHVLVLTAQRLRTQQYGSTVDYEAVLWETTTRRLVWKGAPKTPLSALDAAAAADRLAADTLQALRRNGLVAPANP